MIGNIVTIPAEFHPISQISKMNYINIPQSNNGDYILPLIDIEGLNPRSERRIIIFTFGENFTPNYSTNIPIQQIVIQGDIQET